MKCLFCFSVKDSSPWLSPIWDGSSSKTERLSSLEFIILKIFLISLFHQFQIIHWSILNFNTPLVGHSPHPNPGIWTFENWPVHIPDPQGQMPYPTLAPNLTIKCPSPKTKGRSFTSKWSNVRGMHALSTSIKLIRTSHFYWQSCLPLSQLI